jgi:hypothetical protein
MDLFYIDADSSNERHKGKKKTYTSPIDSPLIVSGAMTRIKMSADWIVLGQRVNESKNKETAYDGSHL